jgi:hypothetical protein
MVGFVFLKKRKGVFMGRAPLGVGLRLRDMEGLVLRTVGEEADSVCDLLAGIKLARYQKVTSGKASVGIILRVGNTRRELQLGDVVEEVSYGGEGNHERIS